jgi:hypothetical protein
MEPRFGLGVIWSHFRATLFQGLSCGGSILQDMAGLLFVLILRLAHANG